MKLVLGKFFTNSVAVFLIVFSANSLAADSSSLSNKIWKNINDQSHEVSQLASKSISPGLIVRTLELNELEFELLLNENIISNDNPLAARSLNAQKNVSKTITLPLPNGNEVNVIITPSSAMSPALAEQFPEIKTWTVFGVSDEITGTIDFTHRGFHGMLIMPDGDRIFIEPEAENASSNLSQLVPDQLSTQSRYISFSEKQNQDSFNTEFRCGVHDDSKLHFNTAAKASPTSARLQAKAAPSLITYRLAVATTGEYSQFHGGTTASTLSAIVTTINRVNQIYMRDLGIKFELVTQQSDIIYLNPDTDPYTNSSVFSLIDENDINLSSNGALSKTEYDIGHVFGAGNVGGLATVGGVCNDIGKAIGATGIFRPIGDAFALDFVAHELGHQVGGTHTFNSACGDGSERTGETAVEPGSGTTIMAYPGICQANNIQNSVDPQFHVVSIDQIRAVTRTGGGSSCGVSSSTANE
ncbi:MAG: reprolysin-like metallopeptidase, partial [Cocleimonas sp.]